MQSHLSDYTNAWSNGLHKKSQMVEYIELMIQEKRQKAKNKLVANDKMPLMGMVKISSIPPNRFGN